MVAQGKAAQQPQPWVNVQINPLFSSFASREKANDEKSQHLQPRSQNVISDIFRAFCRRVDFPQSRFTIPMQCASKCQSKSATVKRI